MGRAWAAVTLALGSWLLIGSAAAQDSESPRVVAAKPFELGLHARVTRASARNEQAAWLTLALPLDAWAQPRLAQPSAPVAPLPSTPPSPDTAPRADAASFSIAELRELGAFAHRAKSVALAVAGAASERRRLEALSTRARLSAALPELRLRAQRDTDQALRWAPTADDPYRVTQADGAGTTLEASLTFQLERLLFSRDELAIERLRADAASERSKLEARVLTALWGLLRAQELGCVPGIEDADRAEQHMRLVEHFGALDDLTAGWFSAHAGEFARLIWGFPEAISGACAPPQRAAAAAATNAVASLENSE